MPFEQENHVERNATNPTPGTAAIAQQAWAPRSGQENTAAPAQTQSDMQKALDQGLAAVGNLFGGIFHGAENGVKTVGNEAQQVGAPQPATQAAEQQSQQAAKQSNPSESSTPATQESNGLQQFGSGIVKGLGDMFNEAGSAIGYVVTHPVETLVKAEQIGEKAAEKFVGGVQTAVHVADQIATGDVNGLRDDAQQVGKSIENGWNTAVKGADYLMSATPEEKGEFFGHYVLPEIAIGLATDGIGNAAMGAAMGAMGLGEAALGAGIAVTGATEAGIAMTGTTEMAIGFTGVTEAGIALTEETEVAVNLLGTAGESGLMQVGKTVLTTVADAIEDGEKGVEGAAKKVKEGFDHAHETIKKAAEVAEQAGNTTSSAERVGEAVGKIAATTMPSADSTLPSLEIVEHSAHSAPDFTEIDRLFGKNSKPITDPKEFERQIAELTRNLEHSAKQTPNNLTKEERIIAEAIEDLQKHVQPQADDDNVFSILERNAKAIAV